MNADSPPTSDVSKSPNQGFVDDKQDHGQVEAVEKPPQTTSFKTVVVALLAAIVVIVGISFAISSSTSTKPTTDTQQIGNAVVAEQTNVGDTPAVTEQPNEPAPGVESANTLDGPQSYFAAGSILSGRRGAVVAVAVVLLVLAVAGVGTWLYFDHERAVREAA